MNREAANRDDQQRPPAVPSDTLDGPLPIGPDVPPIGELIIEDTEAAIEIEGAIRSGKLAGKSMWAAIWILSLPVMVQQLMAAALGLVDKILAGSLPGAIVVPALDAISIGSYVGWFIGIAMAGLGIGGQALIARSIGAGRLDEAGRALGQAMVLSVAWGTMVGIAMWLSAAPLAVMCQLSPDAQVYCVQYIQIIAYAMPLTGVMMVGSMCLHGAGETTLPAVIAAVTNVVNIFFSWMLSGVDIRFGGEGGVGGWVLVNPFTFDLHVIGIAAGTSISYAAGALMTVWVLVRGVKDLRLEKRHLAVDPVMEWRMVRLGVPNFFEGLAMWAVNLIVLIFIGRIALGGGANGAEEGLQGAHIIAVQWEAISFLPGFAMGIAAGALAGQYLGAGNPRMAAKAILACAGIACAIMGTLGFVFMFAGEALTSVISTHPVHMHYAPRLLFICGLVQVFFAIGMVVRYGLRGAGDAVWPFIITSVSSYFVRLPLAWFLGVYMDWGLEGIWWGLCIELVVRGCLYAARFLQGGWKRLVV